MAAKDGGTVYIFPVQVQVFMVFAGDRYQPEGGWYDHIGTWSHKDDALGQGQSYHKNGYDWAHVVDVVTNEIIWNSQKI